MPYTNIGVGFALGADRAFSESIYALGDELLSKAVFMQDGKKYVPVDSMKEVFKEGGFTIPRPKGKPEPPKPR